MLLLIAFITCLGLIVALAVASKRSPQGVQSTLLIFSTIGTAQWLDPPQGVVSDEPAADLEEVSF